MSTRTNTQRGAHSAKKSTSHRGRRPWMFAAIAAVAIAAVVALVVIQTSSGGSAAIPPRIVTGEGRVLGEANAPITVVEYADFQCPICKRAESSIVSPMEADYIKAGKVKLEFRMFPFLGQESFNAAQAADAAADQGKFWEYHDALFNAQGAENGGAFTYQNLVAIAQQVGLDVPRFEAALNSNQYLATVQQEADSARSNGVSSTPTFFIGDTKIVGAQPYAQFKATIDAALAKAGR